MQYMLHRARQEDADMVQGGGTAVFDLGALQYNLKLMRQAVNGTQEIMACVKANAYGHGSETVARCLEDQGVQWLAVGTVAEAIALRHSGITSRILLFPVVGERPNKLLYNAGITISIQSYPEAEGLARDIGASTSVFLKVDSGLGRFGASTTDAVQIVGQIVSNLPSIRLEGLFTHLPFFDAKDVPWVQAQLLEFGRCVASIREIVKAPLLVQALASSGIIFRLDAPGTNAVCPGLLLYGIESPSPAVALGKASLLGTRPVLKEISSVLGGIREIPPDTRYGFGGALVAHKKTRLGVIPMGFSNSLLVSRDGQVANVLGCVVPIVAVSLEQAVLDITDIPGAYDGCPVILLSRDPAYRLPLDEVARRQRRSPVEVLVSLTSSCNRSYLGTGDAPATADKAKGRN
jgi:alanine racemase